MAYNKLNGLLLGIITPHRDFKQEWGFEGFVISTGKRCTMRQGAARRAGSEMPGWLRNRTIESVRANSMRRARRQHAASDPSLCAGEAPKSSTFGADADHTLAPGGRGRGWCCSKMTASCAAESGAWRWRRAGAISGRQLAHQPALPFPLTGSKACRQRVLSSEAILERHATAAH
jgi:hypothetical protein